MTVAASPFLTVPEIAALLRAPVSWVYEHTRRVGPEAIPCYRRGKRLLFDSAEVLAWFKETQRHALRPVDRRRKRRAPNAQPGGHRARKAVQSRVSANETTPVATVLPPVRGIEAK